jgi:hypothetical protein
MKLTVAEPFVSFLLFKNKTKLHLCVHQFPPLFPIMKNKTPGQTSLHHVFKILSNSISADLSVRAI